MRRSACTFAFGRELFLRGLGLAYLAAFGSFWSQAAGLVGERGILPAAGDAALHGVCAAGVLLAAGLALGAAPRWTALGLWALYLWIAEIGEIFLGYQWDALLLEAGLLAVWLAPGTLRLAAARDETPPRAPLFLTRWLVLRLFLLSGLVKILSADPTWRDFSALSFHYWTQPLPNPASPFAHALPAWVHAAAVAVTFAVEVVLPLGVFGPRAARLAAALGFTAFQILINATGSYGFFGPLSVAPCALLVDDDAWRRVPLLGRLVPDAIHGPRRRPPWRRALAALAVALVLAASSAHAWRRLVPTPVPAPLAALARALAPLRSFHAYGLFADMTTDRPEIEVEGSRDGRTWLAYEFRWKPDRLDERPRFAGLHMPRLDWQMWFAALGSCRGNPWFLAFQRRLLEAEPAVLGLLAGDPFEGARPRFVRSTLWRYRFTDADTRRASGHWWERERLAPYCPVLELGAEGLRIADP